MKRVLIKQKKVKLLARRARKDTSSKILEDLLALFALLVLHAACLIKKLNLAQLVTSKTRKDKFSAESVPLVRSKDNKLKPIVTLALKAMLVPKELSNQLSVRLDLTLLRFRLLSVLPALLENIRTLKAKLNVLHAQQVISALKRLDAHQLAPLITSLSLSLLPALLATELAPL